jgi:hypothetical protein
MTTTRAGFALLLIGLFAGAAAKGKRTRHPVGFTFELPEKWRWEEAADGGVLLPQGVVVDPDKEDNPEVYSINGSYREATSERQYIEGLKADFKAANIAIDRGGDLENFTVPGSGGVIYTFDFTHPKHKVPYRMRVFAMTPKGRVMLLIASGHRQKLEQRDKLLREVARSLDWK